jgi:hypothetical protein
MAKKANSLSFLIGPPMEPPNHWREYGTPCEIVVLFAGSGSFWSALKASLRKKPKPEPWKLLVPDFVITLIAAPAERPFTAEKRCVETWNSCTASAGSCITGPPTVLSLLSTPFTVTFTLRPPWYQVETIFTGIVGFSGAGGAGLGISKSNFGLVADYSLCLIDDCSLQAGARRHLCQQVDAAEQCEAAHRCDH